MTTAVAQPVSEYSNLSQLKYWEKKEVALKNKKNWTLNSFKLTEAAVSL